jgi:hypothetical protein
MAVLLMYSRIWMERHKRILNIFPHLILDQCLYTLLTYAMVFMELKLVHYKLIRINTNKQFRVALLRFLLRLNKHPIMQLG